jgi:Family of unknown function (DUF6186)
MTLRQITFVVWGALAACVFAAVALSLTSRAIPTPGAAIRALVRRRYVQVVCLAAWLWLGWHLFVRSSR